MARQTQGAQNDGRQRVLDFITTYITDNNVPPTIREIQAGAKISSTSMVSYYLKDLEKANLLDRYKRRSRGVVINDPHRLSVRDMLSIPIVGRITCGAGPMPTPDADVLRSAEDRVQIARAMVKEGDDLFALVAQGDSMIDALINDGDIVIMKKDSDVKNGELAAVFLTDKNESTLKRVFKEGRRLKLKPENPTLKPFYVDARHAQIQGRVVCVIRQA
ncbi:MAG: transcriptional repressor LexA [Thermoflexales bacterium]|nr:transcriptional repressor LexA [Thermoflexales bacterium]